MVRAQRNVAGDQPEQARHHSRSDLRRRAGPRSQARPRRRCRRGELLAKGGRAVRTRLRVPDGAQPRRDPGAYAGVRITGAVARLRRMGVQLRTDSGDGGRHRLPRWPAVRPAGARRPDRGSARGDCTAGGARAPAPDRRRSTHRDRADRSHGVSSGRTGDRVLDERGRAAPGRQSEPRLRAGRVCDC